MAADKNRVRIDAILNRIGDGTYDDKLDLIQEAVQKRLSKKQQELINEVRRVFGPNARIETHKKVPTPAIDEFDRMFGPQERDGHDMMPPVEDVLGDDFDGADIESRSPIIGPLDPTTGEVVT